MMAPTHAAIAVAGTTLFLGNPSELALPLAILGSQLPDLDSTKSLMGRVFYPVARYFEQRYSHRTITHSLLATGAIALVSSPLVMYSDVKTWLALPLGHFLSCLSDTCTKQGVALFWPSPVRAIYGNNPNLRLRTGSRAEYWVLSLAVIFSLWLININSAGGIMLNFNRVLGIKEGVGHVYDLYGKNHHVWVNVKGTKTEDRSPVDGRFFLVAQDGEDYILQNRDGVYKTEENLRLRRIVAERGDRATLSQYTMIFNEDDVTAALQQLRRSRPGSAIYLTGTLTIDEPDELIIYKQPNQYETISKTDATVTLKYCPLEVAIAFLKDQYALGSLTVRIVTPLPNL